MRDLYKEFTDALATGSGIELTWFDICSGLNMSRSQFEATLAMHQRRFGLVGGGVVMYKTKSCSLKGENHVLPTSAR